MCGCGIGFWHSQQALPPEPMPNCVSFRVTRGGLPGYVTYNDCFGQPQTEYIPNDEITYICATTVPTPTASGPGWTITAVGWCGPPYKTGWWVLSGPDTHVVNIIRVYSSDSSGNNRVLISQTTGTLLPSGSPYNFDLYDFDISKGYYTVEVSGSPITIPQVSDYAELRNGGCSGPIIHTYAWPGNIPHDVTQYFTFPKNNFCLIPYTN